MCYIAFDSAENFFKLKVLCHTHVPVLEGFSVRWERSMKSDRNTEKNEINEIKQI